MTASMISVYRRRNAETLRRVVAPAREAGWAIALWALDESAPALEAETVGAGAGAKFDLLNEILSRTPPRSGPVVVTDDDYEFVRGDVLSFVELAGQAGLGIAQPAHVLRSNISHRITWRRPLSHARLTSFVEIGPIFTVSAAWRSEIVPFPRGVGMGWGLELDWIDLQPHGLRLGIIDATPIRHLAPVGGGYAASAEWDDLMRRLEKRGHPGWKGLRTTLATWHVWRGTPPWLR